MSKQYLFLAILTCGVLNASAVTITFESLPSGTLVSGANALSSDFTISSTAGNTVRVASGPGPTQAALEDGARDGYRVDFNIGGVNSVSVDIGDFNADPDAIYLRAYDSANNLLVSDTDLLPASLVGFLTLSVAAGSIDHIIFGGEGSGAFRNSVFFDNLTYNVTTSVPDGGSSLLLLGLSAAMMQLVHRRRNSQKI